MNLGNLLQEVSFVLASADHLMLYDEKSPRMGCKNVNALRFPGVNAGASGKTTTIRIDDPKLT